MVTIAGHGIESPEFLSPLFQGLFHSLEAAQQGVLGLG
jgi:hypothetical protein